MSPLPEDVQLPCGWVCARDGTDSLVFSYTRAGIEARATRTDESNGLSFDLSGWEVACRKRARESMSEHSVGRVTTRTAAADALYACMERISSLVRTGSTDDIALSAVVEDVALHGEIRPTNACQRDDGRRRVRLSH